MALIETRFKGYHIDDSTYEAFSSRSGLMKPLKISYVKNTKRKNAKPYAQVGVPGCSLLHRLIADTFVAPVVGMTVNHKNGDTLDNHPDNLEVVTQRENCIHAVATGLVPLGERHGKAKYSDELLISALGEHAGGASIKVTAKKYGINQSYLNKVKNKTYRAYLMESLQAQQL